MLARPDQTHGAEVIDISTVRGMGDNSKAATADFIQKRRQIWAARVPAAVKIVALAIIEHMNPEKLDCNASKERLAFMCNMPRATFDRHYNAAKALFHYQERQGKTTVFSPKMLNVAKELAILWPTEVDDRNRVNRYRPPVKMREGQNEPPSNMTPPQNEKPPLNLGEGKAQTPPQFEHEPPLNLGDRIDKGIDKEEKKDSSTASNAYSQSFEDFWKKYPRREGKGKAYTAWKRLNGVDRKKASAALDVQLPTLILKMKDHAGNFCPHAATWLGQRRFDDDVSCGPAKPEGMSQTVWDRLQEDERKAKANGGISLW